MTARAAAAVLIAAALAGCAVEGYELGWRDADRIAPLLGRPLDPLGGCRHGPDAGTAAPACRALVGEIGRLAAALPQIADAPEALGAPCRAGVCSYANVYERRDVGAAMVVPIFRKVALREALARFVRGPDGLWSLAALSVKDMPPPTTGGCASAQIRVCNERLAPDA